MQYIAFDAHKHYTWAAVESPQGKQVEEALLNGQILEQYPDTGRGESCLVVGFAGDMPIHAVCGWRGEKIVLITVYILYHLKFMDPWI
jgi:hypothetical protein